MEFIKKTAKNYSMNVLWIFMFTALWPIEDFHTLRIAASFFMAFLLAVLQAIFKD